MLGLNYTPAPTQARRPALFTPAARPDAAAANGGPVPARQPYALAASDMHLAGPSAVEEEEEAPSAGMMHAFAQALEQWTATVDDPTKVASHMPLLAAYEKICDREIEALEARLQQPSNSATRAGAIEAEATLLRGERSSWRLLRLLYSDFDARQQPPPPPPSAPHDWGRELRALGPAPPRLGAAEIAARAADGAAGGGLSRGPAAAGLAVRSLHDEAVLEAALVASDPILDLGGRLKGWLEHGATERVRAQEVNAEMVWTRNRLEAALGERAAHVARLMQVSPSLDGLRRAAMRAGVPQDASAAALAEALAAHLGVGGEAGEQAAHLPSSLDPDAPYVEGRRLDTNDEAAQAALLRAAWQLVRAGSVGRAMALCRRCGQEWRAATLGGGEPWRYDAARGAWHGNPERALWRTACDAIALRAGAHAEVPGAGHEAAMYGALAGSASALPLVLAACEGWEDKAWARLNATLTTHLDGVSAAYKRLATSAGEDGGGAGGGVSTAEEAAARRLTPDALLAALDGAADADAGDAPAAWPHHTLQRRLFDLRVAQLPSADAGASAGGAPAGAFAFGGGGDDGVGVGIRHAAAAAAASTAAEDGALERFLSAVTAPATASGAAASSAAPSAVERAHLLRFGAHVSIFLYPPLLGARAPGAPGAGRRGRRAAAVPRRVARPAPQLPRDPWARDRPPRHERRRPGGGGAAPPAHAAAAAAPTLGFGHHLVVGGGPGAAGALAAPRAPTVEQMCGAVALLAGNLYTSDGGGMDDALIVRVLGGFLASLPPSMPRERMASCMSHAHRLLSPHLAPQIALHAAMALHAQPLAPDGAPDARPAMATLAAAVARQMDGLRWLALTDLAAAAAAAAATAAAGAPTPTTPRPRRGRRRSRPWCSSTTPSPLPCSSCAGRPPSAAARRWTPFCLRRRRGRRRRPRATSSGRGASSSYSSSRPTALPSSCTRRRPTASPGRCARTRRRRCSRATRTGCRSSCRAAAA